MEGKTDPGMPERIKSLEDRLQDLRAELRERDKIQTDRYHQLRNDVASVRLLADRMERHGERIKKLEDTVENLNIAVLARDVAELAEQVTWMVRTGVVLIVTIISGIVVILATHYQ